MFAKPPAPSDEAKAKTADAASKAARDDKVGLYEICQAMDRSAEGFRRNDQGSGKGRFSGYRGASVRQSPSVYADDTGGRQASRSVRGAFFPGKATSAELTGPRK